MKKYVVLEGEAYTIYLRRCRLSSGADALYRLLGRAFYISLRYIDGKQALGNTETSKQTLRGVTKTLSLLFFVFFFFSSCILGPLSGAICRKEIEQLVVPVVCLGSIFYRMVIYILGRYVASSPMADRSPSLVHDKRHSGMNMIFSSRDIAQPCPD